MSLKKRIFMSLKRNSQLKNIQREASELPIFPLTKSTQYRLCAVLPSKTSKNLSNCERVFIDYFLLYCALYNDEINGNFLLLSTFCPFYLVHYILLKSKFIFLNQFIFYTMMASVRLRIFTRTHTHTHTHTYIQLYNHFKYNIL